MEKLRFYVIYLMMSIGGTLLFSTSCTDDDKWNPGETEVTADFDYTSDQENAPATLKISNKSTGGYTYLWTTAGASPTLSFDKEPTLRYTKEGTYDIKLRVCNNTNCREITKQVTVKAPLPVEVAALFDYELVDKNDYSPAGILFKDKSTNPTAWEWVFAGGTPGNSDKQDPGIVTFASGDKHEVSLKAKNGTAEATFKDFVKVYPGELVCKSMTEEVWKAPISYSNMTIGGITIYLDRTRKNAETEENSISGYQLIIFGAAMNIITGGKETEDLTFQVNASWDWYTEDSPSLDMTVYYKGYKGGFTANISELSQTTMKLDETKFDPTFTQLISSVDGSGTLLTLLSQPHNFTKGKP